MSNYLLSLVNFKMYVFYIYDVLCITYNRVWESMNFVFYVSHLDYENSHKEFYCSFWRSIVPLKGQIPKGYPNIVRSPTVSAYSCS